ncbi:MAG TPA: D-tyrosyl-tRNA(Tyr) deacylase [Clostridiales bacterium]|nr:D-tyrosyl-tRNA(Tyr) deacylase [Clostridiales bacterium]
MKAVIQRVLKASVEVDGKIISSIDHGFMILLGIYFDDTEREAELLAKKTAALRIFSDSDDKMNLSLLDVGGDVLVVSNFTLCADTRKGNRPSFSNAMEPKRACELYNLYAEKLKIAGVKRVETGIFGADMKVALCNDGPVTVILDTDTWKKD